MIRGERGTGTLPDEQRALLLETATEHLWRILVDWSAHLGVQLPAAELRAARLPATIGADDSDAVLSRLVFGLPTHAWLETMTDCSSLRDWAMASNTIAAHMMSDLFRRGWCDAGACEAPFLPETPAAELQATLSSPSADEFVERPVWEAHPCETSPLARNQDSGLVRHCQALHGRGLLARHVALLVELAQLPRQLEDLAVSEASVEQAGLPSNTGVSQVDAARGRLVHRVVLDGDCVDTWQIVAPTEWNFHPDGVLAHSLAALPGGNRDKLRAQAELLVRAVDPCVGFELEVH